MVGAGIVALGAQHALPQTALASEAAAIDASSVDGTSLADRQAAGADRASRAERGAPVNAAHTTGTWRLPLMAYTISSPFEAGHNPGVDFAAPEGTPYYSVSDGTVILARWNAGMGYTAMVDHGNGVVTVYGHSMTVTVKEGQQVKAGDSLGLTGNSGYSTTPHLHFEVQVDDAVTDPSAFLADRGVDLDKHIEGSAG
jgi:murein DD-endopeptidase MepM/ murein hydrolase activator NlpD